MLLILLILIFVRPFISSLAFPYLNSVYSALLMFFLIIWIIQKGISFKKVQSLKIPLILFSSALIISMIFSVNKPVSLNEIVKYLTCLSLFLIIPSLTTETRLRLLQTIAIAGLIISILAIYQYFFGFRHLLAYVQKQHITNTFTVDYINSQRVFFPFITPNTLGGYLIMIIPLLLIDKSIIWFIFPLSFALLLTKSLGALLSLFLASIVYVYLQRKPARKKIIFLSGLLITIGAVFVIRSAVQKEYLRPVFSTLTRLDYWEDALKIIKASPLVGVGMGNFNLIHSRFAHNSYLQIWAEMGFLGLISFFWIIIRIYFGSLKNIRDKSEYYQILPPLIFSSSAFLFHNIIDFSFFLAEASVTWWIILGMIASVKKE